MTKRIEAETIVQIIEATIVKLSAEQREDLLAELRRRQSRSSEGGAIVALRTPCATAWREPSQVPAASASISASASAGGRRVCRGG